MGNSGFRKLLFPGDFVETEYFNAYQTKVVTLEKEEIPLDQYRGELCLFVNTGSNNKDTEKQINQLKELQNKYKDQKFTVLAFPCNQFGNEPYDFNTIKLKYQQQFGINFPVFAKVEVNGKYTHPLFQFLKRNSKLYDNKLLTSNRITQDYYKFLVSREGKVIKEFPKSAPFEEIVENIEKNIK